MICCTILGIAVFAIFRRNYLLRNASTHDPKKKNKDFISQLPNEILVSIISRTSTKDSIRTSVLSKRWRDLYKSVPNVNLSCNDLVIKRANDELHNSFVMTNRLRKYLLLRSGSKIHSFSLRCCRHLPQDFESFVYSLARLQVEELDLLFLRHTIDLYPIFHFSCHLLCEMQSLKYFHLEFCCLTPNLKSQKFCNSLQTLVLSSVEVAKGALECIFSNCLSLHTLKIEECKLCYFSKLCISGPNLRLKSLLINTCKGLQEIEFYAPNLVRFELISSNRVEFIFNHVPLLQTIFLHFYEYYSIAYIHGTLSKDLPHLKSLSLVTSNHFYQESIRMNIFAFSNLRRLDINLNYKTNIDLLSLIPFLQSCPILQVFHLNTSTLPYSGAQVRKNQVVVPHKELQSVETTGFCGAKNEMDFALYIVKSAVALEKMHIFRRVKKYMGLDRWSYTTDDKITWSKRDCYMIHKQLKGEIVSKKAQIIVQSALLHEVKTQEWR